MTRQDGGAEREGNAPGSPCSVPARQFLAPSRRALRRFLPCLAALVFVYALIEGQWYTTAPQGNPELGANFSCKRAEYLGQDCRAALTEVLDGLGVRLLRLSVYWSDVEQQPGVYDWSSIDWQLDAAHQRGARVVVSIGMKAQRYPEYWLPTWLRLTANIPPQALPEDHPLVQQYLFPYLTAAARHVGAHPAVEAIQVENEPYVNYRPNRLLRLIGREHYAPTGEKALHILFLKFGWNATTWHISERFLAREVEAVRAAAPAQRLVLNHASWVRTDSKWRSLLRIGDVFGQSVYTKRQQGPWPWLYLLPYRLGPLSPNLPGQARAAATRGKELWITELQAEPFEAAGLDERRLSSGAVRSFSPSWLEHNLRVARRSGATRVYLWGVEWWLYQRDRQGDARFWDAGKHLWMTERARGPAAREAAQHDTRNPLPPPAEAEREEAHP